MFTEDRRIVEQAIETCDIFDASDPNYSSFVFKLPAADIDHSEEFEQAISKIFKYRHYIKVCIHTNQKYIEIPILNVKKQNNVLHFHFIIGKTHSSYDDIYELFMSKTWNISYVMHDNQLYDFCINEE